MNKHIKNPEYCLSGVLKCAHCGSNINVKRRVKDGVATYSYICPKHDSFGNVRCAKKDLNFEETNQLVFLIIKRYMNNFVDMEKALQDMANSSVAKRKIEDLKMLTQQKEAELRKVKIIKSRLYEDMCGGLLDESDYTYMSKKYAEEIRSIEDVIKELKCELEIYVVQKETDTPVEKKLNKFAKSRKLSKAMVDAFIQSIVVDNDGRFEVAMKIKDEYDSLFRQVTLCEGGLQNAV